MEKFSLSKSMRAAIDQWQHEQSSLREAGTMKFPWRTQRPDLKRGLDWDVGISPHVELPDYLGHAPLTTPDRYGVQARASLIFRF